MAKPGRISAAASLVPSASAVEIVRRPDPPHDLTDEQAEEWVAIVSRLPADWFPRETHGVLSQYCRHIVAARRIAQLIANAENSDRFDLGEYDLLLKLQEREGRALSSLATRMRITQQTQYDKTKKRGTIGRKPWEVGQDE